MPWFSNTGSLIKQQTICAVLRKDRECLHHLYVTADVLLFGEERSGAYIWRTIVLSTKEETIAIVFVSIII